MDRKSILVLFILLGLVMVLPGIATADMPKVQINDKIIDFEAPPVIEGGLCIVPLRPVMEAMGAKMYWNKETNHTNVYLPGVNFSLVPSSATAQVNGKNVTLPVVPTIRDGNMYVPLRAVVEICGASLIWNAESSTAVLSKEVENMDIPMDREAVHQVSMFNALLEGLYDGEISFQELADYGDTGIGTFEGLDGEMIELDGLFYQIKADGKAYPVTGDMKTPFASVTFFDADKSLTINDVTVFAELQKRLDNMITNKNIFYTIKATGTFKYVKTRSVPGQQKPYPPLAEVTKNQPVFEFNNVKGTLVGFWCPAYAQGINVPGYHVHFLNESKNAGGHLLDFIMEEGQIELDATPNFYMSLPLSDDFGKLDLAKDRTQETQKTEK